MLLNITYHTFRVIYSNLLMIVDSFVLYWKTLRHVLQKVLKMWFISSCLICKPFSLGNNIIGEEVLKQVSWQSFKSWCPGNTLCTCCHRREHVQVSMPLQWDRIRVKMEKHTDTVWAPKIVTHSSLIASWCEQIQAVSGPSNGLIKEWI